jgi:hypothetical protein
MHYNPVDPLWPHRDRFVLAKGTPRGSVRTWPWPASSAKTSENLSKNRFPVEGHPPVPVFRKTAVRWNMGPKAWTSARLLGTRLVRRGGHGAPGQNLRVRL